MLNLINAVLGGALLLMGRKLFWLFVGVIGFVFGAQVAPRFFHGSELLTIGAGLVLGLIFAGLAVFVETVAIGVAGFLGGGYILLSLASALGMDKGALIWVAFLLGGVIGVVLIVSLFDWALISISSLAGAATITQALHVGAVFFLLFFIVGVSGSGRLLPHRPPARSLA